MHVDSEMLQRLIRQAINTLYLVSFRTLLPARPRALPKRNTESRPQLFELCSSYLRMSILLTQTMCNFDPMCRDTEKGMSLCTSLPALQSAAPATPAASTDGVPGGQRVVDRTASGKSFAGVSVS